MAAGDSKRTIDPKRKGGSNRARGATTSGQARAKTPKGAGGRKRQAQALELRTDGLSRCPWPGSDPIYIAYHDDEWGAPEFDDRALFEKLLLDGFQAGLSWITILRKRPAFRQAFDNFDPEKIARYDRAKLNALMLNEGIVRNRAKIEGAVLSAQAFLALREREGLSQFLWKRMDGRPIQNAFDDMRLVPTQTPLSCAISKDLKAHGFKFCGPTIVYAFMQAVGMVNDHLTTCCRREACRRMAEAIQ